jgi:anti-anti-sigma regulatory factor
MRAEGGEGKVVKDEVLMAIEEELDVDKASQAEAELERTKAGSRLVLDLSRVSRFNFSGIVILMSALARLQERFSAVCIEGLSERVSDVFLALRPPALQRVRVVVPEEEPRRWRR